MSDFVFLVLFAVSLVIIPVGFINLAESWHSMSDEKDKEVLNEKDN